MAYRWGDPNNLLTGVILQAGHPKSPKLHFGVELLVAGSKDNAEHILKERSIACTGRQERSMTWVIYLVHTGDEQPPDCM